MKTLYGAVLISIATMALVGIAQATQPPDAVSSDANFNTAMGTSALLNLSADMYGNTATGNEALYSYNAGYANTASGAFALHNNYGHFNTAAGYEALYFNSSGIDNTASGYGVLYLNTTGNYNTASGSYALESNTGGNDNTASGYVALDKNTTGNSDTASGYQALYSNTTGSNNIAAGFQAGYNLTTGSNNIDIGNVGVAGESNTIRLGTRGIQKVTVIAGIYGTPVSGSAVFVSSTGRLGVTVSSERYKTAIAPIGSGSSRLEQLRPVTFHLRTDPTGTPQYGLIAEEVARVYPELVIRDESGRIDGVRYDELAPMLLNEMKQQRAQMTERLEAQAAEIRVLRELIVETRAALVKLQPKEDLLALR